MRVFVISAITLSLAFGASAFPASQNRIALRTPDVTPVSGDEVSTQSSLDTTTETSPQILEGNPNSTTTAAVTEASNGKDTTASTEGEVKSNLEMQPLKGQSPEVVDPPTVSDATLATTNNGTSSTTADATEPITAHSGVTEEQAAGQPSAASPPSGAEIDSAGDQTAGTEPVIAQKPDSEQTPTTDGQSLAANGQSLPTGDQLPTTPKQSPTAGGQGTCINGTGPGNYVGLCSFSCSFGVCPAPCTCSENGTPPAPPPQTPEVGLPLTGEPDDYAPLCAFTCSHGYCPETACKSG